MTRRTRRFPRLAIAIVAVALAAPVSAAGYTDTPGQIDLRSPDAVDAARQVEEAQQAQLNAERISNLDDRREAPGYVDHRSPDAVDTRFVQTPEPATIVASDGFDWGDAGIGAGAVLGLLLIGLSVMFTVVHHRNRTATV